MENNEYFLDRESRERQNDPGFEKELRRLLNSYGLISRLWSRIARLGSKRGRIDELEEHFIYLERKAVKDLGYRVNRESIDDMQDEELRMASVRFWGYREELRNSGKEYKRLTGKKAFSSPNYCEAKALIRIGIKVIENEKERRWHEVHRNDSPEELE